MNRSFLVAWCLCTHFILSQITGFSAKAQQITKFKENDRVVFLGNSITDGGHYHAYIWLYYMTRFPQMNVLFLNAGIGGDRAIEMLKRLDSDVFSKQPTILVTTFGMNDSGYFEYNQPDADKFADSKVKESYDAFQQMEKRFKELHDTRIVLIGSSPYDEEAKIEGNIPFKNKNKAMMRIVDFQKQAAQANHWEFFDYNQPMTQLNRRFQQKDSTFTLCGNDRIHPDNDGHMVMAYLFLKAQGFVGSKIAEINIDAAKQKTLSTENCTISNLQKTSSGISFDYQANALPYPLDTVARGWGAKKAQSQATNIVPFVKDMNQELLIVKGLKGKNKLFIDDEPIGTWTTEEFAAGINLAELSHTPQYQQALKVMHLNEDRWEIERKFRDYAWLQYNFFAPKGLLEANNRQAIEAYDKNINENGWLPGKRDGYSKSMFPEVRKIWQTEMDLLLTTIKEVNKPQKRKITLVPTN